MDMSRRSIGGRRSLLRTRFAIAAIIVLLLASPVIAIGYVRAGDDRPYLEDVRAPALPLFRETAGLIDPEFGPRPHPGSDPSGPLDIPQDPFGYQHCDGWRGWFLPGWSAATWHDFEIANENERAEVIAQVRAIWTEQEGDLTIRNTADVRPLQLHIGEISYSLVFPENHDMPGVPDGMVSVSIGCLPVD